jgi:flavin-binding protein dodecin
MVVKVIEIIGTSKKSFDDALKSAIKRASKTLRNITGADILGQKVVLKNGKIVEYRVHLKIAFLVE